MNQRINIAYRVDATNEQTLERVRQKLVELAAILGEGAEIRQIAVYRDYWQDEAEKAEKPPNLLLGFSGSIPPD